MALTQKYKQQQQQVRVLTNESNYLRGMYFSDVPLAEGYSRVLVNFDIDSLSGKIKPRKGLQSLGIVYPSENSIPYLNNSVGFNVVVDSRVCAASDTVDPRQINRYLQTILYNTDTRTLVTATSAPEITEYDEFKVAPFSIDSGDEYIASEPFIIPNPGVHGKLCIHNNFFKRPVGTFAFGNSFYTFLRHSTYSVHLIDELPNDKYTIDTPSDDDSVDSEVIGDYATLKASDYAIDTDNIGGYFKFVDGPSKGVIAYYDEAGVLQSWDRSEEALKQQTFRDTAEPSSLCFTRLGADIKQDNTLRLLDPALIKNSLSDNQFYVCTATPKQLSPTEASTWGYNMLLQNPYDFVCEDTAVNMVTILGMLPYGKDNLNRPVLTPRKNQDIVIKAYFRAPENYYSDVNNARFYATTKKKITAALPPYEQFVQDERGRYRDKDDHIVEYGYVIKAKDSKSITVQQYYYVDDAGESHIVKESDLKTETITDATETRDPKTRNEIPQTAGDLQKYNFGDWWYCTEEKKYYMIVPGISLNIKQLEESGRDEQPDASEKLNIKIDPESKSADKIRVRWQIRSAGAASWTDIANYITTLEEHDKVNHRGDPDVNPHPPFVLPLTIPDNEVLIRLTISDPLDTAKTGDELEEEYVLSTNTIGLSAVSDELANTLNLDAKNFDLGRCTGMCEWEQRLVLWGVPGALNTLFVSDVNNPTFFPYPNNVDIFTDPIIAVHNYGDELLVLTTSALYRLIWDTEGTGWSHKLVQQNLHVTEADTYMSCVIKNMFFFKSGEYYYMMVPKTTSAASVRGEVTIAPISKPIENLLDNFHAEIYNLIKVIIDRPDIPDFTDNLVNYFSYVDNTKVVVNYVYALQGVNSSFDWINDNTEDWTLSRYLYVQLIYDTDARTWSMRIFEAPHMLYASHADAIQQDRFIDLTPALNGDRLVIQYYKFLGLKDECTQCINEENELVSTLPVIKNYQYLDTGNRDINTELKKRFREFQFKLKNNTNTNLGFFTSFLIDGSLRKDLQHYSPRFLLDPSTNEATVVVERVLDTKTMTYNTTRVERILIPERMLQDNGELTPTTLAEEKDPDRWILNQSAFPGRTLWKIRMPISGKGLSPRVIMLSTNEADYEILGHDWVYRTMNGR